MKIFAILLALSMQDASENEENRPQAEVRLWHDFSHPDVLSPEEIAGYSLATSELLHLAFDEVILGEGAEQSLGERLLRSLVAFGTLVPLEASLSGAAHEYGHFRGFSLAGMSDFEFVNDGDSSDRINVTPWSAFSTQLGNHWLGGDAYLATVSDWGGFATSDPRFHILMETGGFNQQQYEVELIAQKAQDGRAHPLDAVSYFARLLGVLAYPRGDNEDNSDIRDYADELAELGVKTNANEIRYKSQLLKLVSGSSLALLARVVDYLWTGDKTVRPLVVELGQAKLYWPEFSSHMTLQGPTIKVSERIDWLGNAHFLSFERSLSENVSEYGIGSNGQFLGLPFQYRFFYNTESGYWLEGGPIINITSWLSVGFKAYTAKGYSFQREMFGSVPHFVKERESGLRGFLELNIEL